MLTVDFNLFRVNPGDRVLDAGCGHGRHTWEVMKVDNCLVCSMDICEESLKKLKYVLYHMNQDHTAKALGIALHGDAQNLPFKDGSFDKVICSEVLEHLEDDEQGIRELVRVLKRGGDLVVTVPTYLTEAVYWRLDRDYYNHPGGHVRMYRAGKLIEALCRYDLKVYALRYEHALHSVYWLLRCLFRLKNEHAPIPALYYRFLEKEITTQSAFINLVEDVLNFFIPKSIVIYTRKV